MQGSIPVIAFSLLVLYNGSNQFIHNLPGEHMFGFYLMFSYLPHINSAPQQRRTTVQEDKRNNMTLRSELSRQTALKSCLNTWDYWSAQTHSYLKD